MKIKLLIPLVTALTLGFSSLGAESNITKSNEVFDPFEEMHQMRQHMLKMQEEMDKIFGDFHQKMRLDSHFGDFQPFKHNLFDMKPAVDFEDRGDHYEIKANIPGAENQNISVTAKDGMLNIKATTSRSSEKKDEDKFIKQERYMGSYMRVLSLPKDADESSIKNSYKDGVLTVTVKKIKS